MMDILYQALIYPLVILLKVVLTKAYSLTGSYGFSIMLMSVGVNILLAPFYALADLWQNEEQGILKRMSERQKDIKAVFAGDERHFYLKTLYRHHEYSPLLSIRSSFGLLIQIPFFMAAYNFLSSYTPLEGESFWLLSNLARPDGLLGPVNIMPFLMTAVNIVATLRFSKGQTLRSSIQLYGMALLFLVLLYDSPSGLLLYWTCNNIYSMIRIFLKDSFLSRGAARLPATAGRILKKILLPRTVLTVLVVLSYLCIAALYGTRYFLLEETGILRFVLKLVFVYLGLTGTLFFLKRYRGIFPYQFNALILAGLWLMTGSGLANPLNNRSFPYFFLGFTVLLVFTVILPVFEKINEMISQRSLLDPKTGNALFAKSVLSLAILTAFVIPLLLLNNAPPGEIILSFPHYRDLIVWTLVYIIFLPLFLYRAFPKEYRAPFSVMAVIILLSGIINFLIFPGDYGFINNALQFTSSVEDSTISRFLNLGVIGVAALLPVALVVFNRVKWLNLSLNLVVATLLGISALTFVHLIPNKEAFSDGKAQAREFVPEIAFSKDEPNTVVLMLDRAMAEAVPAAMEEYTSLDEGYDGFIWYENSISYGNCTITGLPALLGGYDYTPDGMDQRRELSLYQKVVEAWNVMPRAFLELGHSVYISDPEYSDLIPPGSDNRLENLDLDISDLNGLYRDYWLNENLNGLSFDDILLRSKSFFLFSLFRLSPSFIRESLYDGGVWHSANPDPEIREKTGNWGPFRESLNSWSTIEYLPRLSYLQKEASFSFIYSMATHEDGGVGPDLRMSARKFSIPPEDIEKYGSADQALDMYTNIAVLEQLIRWFDWMKEQGVYDNTQILIVADHGRGYRESLMDNGEIPRKVFHPLMMYKPFRASGTLKVSSEFMTNADTPSIVLSPFGDFLNPYTGTALTVDAASTEKEKKQRVVAGNSKHDLHKGTGYSSKREFIVSGDPSRLGSWAEK